MKGLRSHFVFNRSERNGIFLLVLIIIFLQGIYFFVDFSSKVEITPEEQEKIAIFQARIDSLKKVAAMEDTLRIRPFNPNFISDFKGYTLGMSVEEIDRLRLEHHRMNDAEATEADDRRIEQPIVADQGCAEMIAKRF